MNGTFIDQARFAMSTRQPAAAAPYRLLKAGGALLRITDRGSGPLTFVFTPDPPNVLEHHEATFASFARHGRVVGLELPGFGHSRPSPAFGYSIEENVDVLLAALDELRVDRAVLVFSCIAGLAALEAARRAPDRVAGVVVAQTPCFDDALTWATRVDFKGLIGTPIVGQLLVRGLRRKLADSWYQAALPRGADTTSFLTEALDAYAAGADYCLASALQALRQQEPPVASVAPPVLSVWGKLDRTHRSSDPGRTIELAPRSRLVVFDDAAHFPDLEQPERFEREVVQFLREESVEA
jgi:pimeloyl-ACP methyl ester carboxylesterase